MSRQGGANRLDLRLHRGTPWQRLPLSVTDVGTFAVLAALGAIELLGGRASPLAVLGVAAGGTCLLRAHAWFFAGRATDGPPFWVNGRHRSLPAVEGMPLPRTPGGWRWRGEVTATPSGLTVRTVDRFASPRTIDKVVVPWSAVATIDVRPSHLDVRTRSGATVSWRISTRGLPETLRRLGLGSEQPG